MATIKNRRKKYSVIYWYVDSEGVRKQKWNTFNTKTEAKARKHFVELYQEANGAVLVPLDKQYAMEIDKTKSKLATPAEQISVKDFMEIYINQVR